MSNKVTFTRHHNGLSKKQCPYGEKITINDKEYVRYVGGCNGGIGIEQCKHLISEHNSQNYIRCKLKEQKDKAWKVKYYNSQYVETKIYAPVRKYII